MVLYYCKKIQMLGNLSEYFVVLRLQNAVIMTVLMSTHNHYFSSKNPIYQIQRIEIINLQCIWIFCNLMKLVILQIRLKD